MLQGLKNTAATLKALKILCDAAVAEAEREGLAEVGAEHFLLAAFDLPDGTARRSFERFRLDAAGLRSAIEGHHAGALEAAGFSNEAMPPPVPITRRPGTWALPASASGRALLERLSHAGPASGPLCGAEVILAALEARRGIVPRTLRQLGIAPEDLAGAARAARDAQPMHNAK